jgi:hypothetical protein
MAAPTAVHYNAAAMAGSVTTRNVVAALASNALQFATFLRRYCNNALDLAALLQCPTAQVRRRFNFGVFVFFCFFFYSTI